MNSSPSPPRQGVLRQMFGPSQDEVWDRLCAETGGTKVEGGFWKGSKVQVRVKEWIITLDIYTVHAGGYHQSYTRMRAPYVNPEGFRFSVIRKHFFSGLAAALGFQDVNVGFPEFDEAFVIRGNNETKLRDLFANPHLRELLSAQPQVCFEVKDDEGWFGAAFPAGVDELIFTIPGQVKEVERLKSLYKLFAVTLDHLCHIGAAYERDPEIRL